MACSSASRRASQTCVMLCSMLTTVALRQWQMDRPLSSWVMLVFWPGVRA